MAEELDFNFQEKQEICLFLTAFISATASYLLGTGHYFNTGETARE
jgi:hypothetical protein